MVIDKKEKVICVLEYTRPSDTKLEVLWEAASRKMSKYLVLLASLNYKLQGWLVQLFQLPVGVRGSLLHTHGIPALEAMGIPERHF